MKNARIVFSKSGECKYISHLDLNRVMLRAVQKSGLSIWRTEGFNRHAYITFALPLSLGMSSACETMDFRLLDDDEELSAVPDRLNACLPPGIRVLSCTEQKYKPADISSAVYTVILYADTTVGDNAHTVPLPDFYSQTTAFLSQPEIIVEKKTKKGMKNIDLKAYILSCSAAPERDGVRLVLELPAGSATNINPNLLISALSDYCGCEMYAEISRDRILTKEGVPFE